MKREGKTKGKKTKIRLAALVAVFLIGIAGAGGGETEKEPADRNMPVTEAMAEVPENGQESEGTELIAEISSTTESEAERRMVEESTATPEPTSAPTSTSEPTPEPTATPTSTPDPTVTPEPTPEPTATPVPTSEPTSTLEPPIEPVIEKASVVEGMDYILNTNKKKFHYPDCGSVKQMKEKNKKYYTGTREECIGMGYEPCGNCRP